MGAPGSGSGVGGSGCGGRTSCLTSVDIKAGDLLGWPGVRCRCTLLRSLRHLDRALDKPVRYTRLSRSRTTYPHSRPLVWPVRVLPRSVFVALVRSLHHPADRSLRVAVDRSNDGAVLLQPSGCLDGSTGDLLCAVVEAEARSGRRAIGIDLQHVGCLDESGMSALRRARRHVCATGGRLTVYGMDLSRLASDRGASRPVLATTGSGAGANGY